ncbi:MAG: GspH/FimT family pseudopilin [Burkholderiaceae bacterium]
MKTNKSSFQSGFTLVELLIAIVVVAILMAIAIPSFLQTLDKRRLVGAADNLLANLRYAQAESIKTNTQITATFTEGATWSYVVNSSPAKTTLGADYQGTSITVATIGPITYNPITFDPKRGMMVQAPAAASSLIEITSALGFKLGLEVSPLSHMRLCSPNNVGGYPACP